MRRWMSLSLMALVVTSTAFAQDAKLRRLDSGVDARAWEAVGRLDLGGTGFCTGALIAPSLVLTAAHCLFDKATGDAIEHNEVEFLAGWRNGRASAYRKVRRAVVHPEYSFGGALLSDDVRNDLALLELDHPIRDGRIMPFGTSERPVAGDPVAVVSYASGRSEVPSLQELCTVIRQQEGVLVTSCAVDFGASGAPIFTLTDGGAQIVSVVSAKAEVSGEDVSLGTSLDRTLDVLRAELVAARDSFGNGSSGGRLSVGGGREDTGAKFVKP